MFADAMGVVENQIYPATFFCPPQRKNFQNKFQKIPHHLQKILAFPVLFINTAFHTSHHNEQQNKSNIHIITCNLLKDIVK